MKILLYLLLILIFFLLYILFRSSKQNIIITILCSFIILKIILNPKTCINWTLEGTKLFFMSVFPSLFPFLVISNLMIYFDGVQIYSKLLGTILCRPLKLPHECSIVLIINALCGYPLGAKYACDLYDKNIIDYKTCEHLLNIASSASPLFLVGALGSSMLDNTRYGYIILISSWTSCIIMGFILSNKNSNYTFPKRKPFVPPSNSTTINLGNALKESIDSSIKNCLVIGGFIVIFYIITNIIKSNALFGIATQNISHLLSIDSQLLQGTLLGLLEMTNGCYLVSISQINIIIKVIIISFLVSFSGLSIISQVYSFTSKYHFSAKKYVTLKLTQALICASISGTISFFLTLLCYL